jgi:hypothetical protein
MGSGANGADEQRPQPAHLRGLRGVTLDRGTKPLPPPISRLSPSQSPPPLPPQSADPPMAATPLIYNMAAAAPNPLIPMQALHGGGGSSARGAAGNFSSMPRQQDWGGHHWEAKSGGAGAGGHRCAVSVASAPPRPLHFATPLGLQLVQATGKEVALPPLLKP